MELTIRKAKREDLPRILPVFDRARAFMAANGNPNQWVGGYPSAELMLGEIDRGVCYLMEGEGMVQGTFCYIPGRDPTYDVIYDGAWPDDKPYATIHRLASAGHCHGVARACFDWCAAWGLPLRADTHADNHPMQHLLEQNGFVRCGIIHLASGSPRIAYARPLR